MTSISPSGETGSDFSFHRGWNYAAFWLIALSTLARLCQLSTYRLVPDEAYYWDWSRHLALGYYDQGPLVAYVIRLSTTLFGTTEFGVRFGVLIASMVCLICVYFIALRFYSPLTAFLAVLFLAVTPLMEVGSIIATYDPLQVCFWAIATLALQDALFGDVPRKQNRAWWIAGLALGIGFLAKHTMLLLAPGLALFLLASPAHRRWLMSPRPYLALLLALCCYSGVLYWNMGHNWWTFRHLFFLAANNHRPFLRRLGDYIGGQALLVGPVLFIAILVITIKSVLAAHRDRFWFGAGDGSTAKLHSERLFLICIGAPVLVFFLVFTVKAKVQGNWAACAFTTLPILIAEWLVAAARKVRAIRLRAVWGAASIVFTSLALTLLIIWTPLRELSGIHIDRNTDPTNTMLGWREIAARVERVRQDMLHHGSKQVFVAANTYQYAALLAFYLPDHPPTYDLFLHARLSMYSAHIGELQHRLGQDAVFVNEGSWPAPYLRQVFGTVTYDEPVTIWRKEFYKEPIRVVDIARCYSFMKYVGLTWANGG